MPRLITCTALLLTVLGCSEAAGRDGSKDEGGDGTSTAVAGGGAATAGSSSGENGGSAATGGSVGSDAGEASAGEASQAGSGQAPMLDNELIGWATVDADGQNGTTGGEDWPENVATSVDRLNSLAEGNAFRVIRVSGSLSGDVEIGENKTIIGDSGAELRGTIRLDGSVNVILRNLTVIGPNCSDAACGEGADTVTIRNAHHLWIDHMDISDGTDGNLDITNGSSYITVSWTKFSYSSSSRSHRFSNLVGSSDNASATDTGRLRITFHHNFWERNVVERMPRVRFGWVHVFNNLNTSSGDNYCVGVGFDANILTENNVFIGVEDPIDNEGYSNDASVIANRGNLYQNTSGRTGELRASEVFDPSEFYEYELDPAEDVEALVRQGAGPR